MKALLPIALAGMVLLGTACSKQETAPSHSIEFQSLHGEYTYRLKGSARDYMRDSDIVCFDSVTLVLPTAVYDLDISALRDSILSAAFDTILPPEQAMSHYFHKTAAEQGYPVDSIAEGPDEMTHADGLLIVDGSVSYLSTSWLTYCVTTAVSMPGAAHGLTTNRYLNYSMATGHLVTLHNLFTPRGLEALPGIIASQARRMASVLGPTSIDALPANDNFLITGEGTIIFTYQPYEVASYAQGEIRVPFYPYQLSDYMTPAALALFHLNDI